MPPTAIRLVPQVKATTTTSVKSFQWVATSAGSIFWCELASSVGWVTLPQLALAVAPSLRSSS